MSGVRSLRRLLLAQERSEGSTPAVLRLTASDVGCLQSRVNEKVCYWSKRATCKSKRSARNL